jgi:hypothetical protein
MKAGAGFLFSIVVLLAVFGTNAEGSRLIRDFSGDAMQRHSSRMMSSPMIRMPTPLGTSFWPFIAYPPAPMMTIVNIHIDVPASDQPPTVPPAPPKFWIERCGIFVQLDVSSTMNLMEEERKPCAH